MPLPVLTEKYEVKKIGLAGSYALDVDWGDGHGSIYPFRDLRLRCPCEACQRASSGVEDPRLRTPVEIEKEPGALRVRWEDDHESRYPWRILRDACQCALCAGERGPVDLYLGKR